MKKAKTKQGQDVVRLLQPIHLAVGTGNIAVVRSLLTAQADANAPARVREGLNDPTYHYAPLHEAAFFDQPVVTHELIRESANILQQNIFGETPLHIAAKQGNVRVATALTRFP